MNFFSRFNIYQKERFPLAILTWTTVAVVLSSGSVATSHVKIVTILLACISGIAYLFHIRVVDEVRDYSHDQTYHATRPIQRGVISTKELQTLDALSVTIFFAIALCFGVLSTVIAIVCVLYTYIAGKEFFLGEKIRARFLLYNAVNLVQMILLQFFVYSLFSKTWYMSHVLWLHLLFIFINAVMLEIVRKIKIAPEESVGHDTYSWHIGFYTSLSIFFGLALFDYAVFVKLVLSNISASLLTISGFFMLSLLISIFVHSHKKTKKTEIYLYLSALGLYIGLNLIIYLAFT